MSGTLTGAQIELPVPQRIPIPRGMAYIASRGQLADIPKWKAAFLGRPKDYRYFEIVEDTLKQGFQHRYLILQDDAGAVRAIQPFFVLDQDLLAGTTGAIRGVVDAIRRLAPRCLVARTLMVGCAAGEGHLDVPTDGGDEDAQWIAASLHHALAQVAREARASLTVLKEFPAAYRTPLRHFSSNGYVRIPSMPSARLSIDYPDFETFMMKGLSKVTRKSFRRKLRAAEAGGPIEMQVLTDITPFVDEVYPLYLAVYEKSKLHFEKLTGEFLCALGREMPDKARFFIWRIAGKAVAFSLCLVNGDAIYDEYVGLDYTVALDLHLYFLTLRDILQWAMKNGYKHYHTSGLNYDSKLHIGCDLMPLDLYVTHRSALARPILRRVLPLVEPTRSDKNLPKFDNFHELWAD